MEQTMLNELLIGLLYASPITYCCGLVVFALVPPWPDSWKKFMSNWPMLVLGSILWPLFCLALAVRGIIMRKG